MWCKVEANPLMVVKCPQTRVRKHCQVDEKTFSKEVLGRSRRAKMLMGSYQNSIDAKSRVIVPARFREELGQKCVLTRGLDDCLILYPMQTWAAQQQKLAELPRSDERARAFIRYIFANATDCEIGRQGRILIPAAYKGMARMDKDLVTIGMLDRVELWAKEVYDASEFGGKLSAKDLEKFSDIYKV